MALGVDWILICAVKLYYLEENKLVYIYLFVWYLGKSMLPLHWVTDTLALVCHCVNTSKLQILKITAHFLCH